MPITIQQVDKDHGQAVWLNRFDAEGFALFGCPEHDCGYIVGLNPYAQGKKHKVVQRGALAKHQAVTNAECITAAYELGIWTPAGLDEEILEKLKEAGGSPFGITALEIEPTDETDPPPVGH